MTKKILISAAMAMALAFTSSAYAEGNGTHNGNNNRGTLNGNLNGNNMSASSRASARASARQTNSQSYEGYNGIDGSGNSTNNFKDRLQAPSFGVGGGWCSNAFSLSVPGGGFGFSSMDRMCRLQIGAEMVQRYISRPNAAAYICNQREFANTVPACIRARAPKR